MAKKRPTKKETAAGRKPSSRQLEKLDREILALLNQRAALTAARDQAGGEGTIVGDGGTIAGIVAQNNGPLAGEAVRAIFRELLSGSRAVARPTRVAFLGPEFTYSHLAAIERFGKSVELTPVGTIAAVFEEVERGQAEFGMVPIENSTDGRVADALECLARSPVKICAEVPLGIHHCLLGTGPRTDIQRVYSKVQPLSQCRKWLSSHLPEVRLCEVT